MEGKQVNLGVTREEGGSSIITGVQQKHAYVNRADLHTKINSESSERNVYTGFYLTHNYSLWIIRFAVI